MAAWREKLGVLGERVADTMTRLQLVDSCTLNLFVALPRSSLSLRGQGHVSCAALWRSAPLWSAGLTSIDLRHTRVDDKFIARLGASEAAETIECLNLSQSQYITDAAIAHLRAFPRLRCTLSLSFSLLFVLLTTHNTQHKVAGSQGLQSSDTGRGRCADSELSLASGAGRFAKQNGD